jgi:hypothetical protein
MWIFGVFSGDASHVRVIFSGIPWNFAADPRIGGHGISSHPRGVPGKEIFGEIPGISAIPAHHDPNLVFTFTGVVGSRSVRAQGYPFWSIFFDQFYHNLNFLKVYHTHYFGFEGNPIDHCVALKEVKDVYRNLKNEIVILKEFAKLEDQHRRHLVKLYQR